MILVCFIIIPHIQRYTYWEKNVREGKTAKVRSTKMTDASGAGVVDQMSMFAIGE